MEFISDYGLFLAKIVTVVVAIVFVIGAIVAQSIKSKGHGGTAAGSISIDNLNDQFDDYKRQLQQAISSDDAFKKIEKEHKKQLKSKKKAPDVAKPRLFTLNFDGDVKASAVEQLREEITAILTVAEKTDEIMINIESPGGMVHTYGLAASQLQRIKDADLQLTVCVDKVAASGGYLMACVADKIIAAPFAIIGSIGVLAQIPNFNRILKKYDVDYEVMTAGEHKAPITMFGEITEKGKGKLKEELEDTHELFKSFITDHRPDIDINDVATGEIWYGKRAINKNLVDEIMTSDSYLMAKNDSHDIYLVSYEEKQTLQQKLGLAMSYSVSAVIENIRNRDQAASISKEIS
ncbi:MAG: protease SohB [Pseudomonadales bacterium]|nr:protease SohB [Pseudomonadales bacterium]